MKAPLTPQQLLAKAQRLCASAEHCPSEVQMKIAAWGGDERTAASIIASLVSDRFIDEGRYCSAFVRDKFRFCQWGRVKIAQALHVKGLPDECITSAMAEIDEREYFDCLRRLMEQKARTLSASSDYERRSKLVRFAVGKGYTLDEAMRVVEAL